MKWSWLLIAAALIGFLLVRRRHLGRVTMAGGVLAALATLLIGSGVIELPNIEKLIEDVGTALGRGPGITDGAGAATTGAGPDGDGTGATGAVGAAGEPALETDAVFFAAGFTSGAAAAAGSASRSRRTTGASTVDDAERTNSPISWSLVMTTLLSIPSSLASS